MANLTNFAENKLIDLLFRAQAMALPADWYWGLFTTTPADGSAGVEVSGGSYARVALTRSLANYNSTQDDALASTGTTGTTKNTGQITFPVPTASWGSITGIGLFDAASAGNCWFVIPLGTAKTVNNGDPAPYVAAAGASFQIDS